MKRLFGRSVLGVGLNVGTRILHLKPCNDLLMCSNSSAGKLEAQRTNCGEKDVDDVIYG